MNDSLDNELREIEAQLANLSPTKMPDDMLNRMEQAMMAWETHLPAEENIVPFNQLDKSTPGVAASTNISPARKSSNLNIWGAAAAIALLASVTAVFMSGSSSDSPVVADNNASTAPLTTAIADSSIDIETPELSRNITHASNEGITYAGKNDKPFKVLRIEYTEKAVSHDKDGNPVITEKPCVEHVLVPVPVH